MNKRKQEWKNHLDRMELDSASQFQCDSGQCIPEENMCDGTNDCMDGSDETLQECVNVIPCSSSFLFRCDYGACINKMLQCDGVVHCKDGSDETDAACGDLRTNSFKCGSDELIDKTLLCDGVANCNDSSDETFDECGNLICPPYSFRCDYGACIAKRLKCNKISDCLDGSDESSCNVRPPLSKNRKGKFECNSGEYIEEDTLCDGVGDCRDKSDEVSQLCSNLNCPKYTYRCKYGACVNQNSRCNGVNDCVDGSDEEGCKTTTGRCEKDNFKCNSGMCIKEDGVCNGKRDCNDGSDENFEICAFRRCSAYMFTCNYGACVPKLARCDGVVDCFDRSDEDNCPAPIQTTTPAPVQTTSSVIGCVVPSNPDHGEYQLFNNKVLPGKVVPNFGVLTLKCDSDYGVPPPASAISVCVKNRWSSDPSICSRKCQRIEATSPIECKYNNVKLENCINAFEGTVAMVQCDPDADGINKSVVSFCRDGLWSYPGDSEEFKNVENKIQNRIKTGEVYYRPSFKEIDRIVLSLSDKFALHGFSARGKNLQMLFKKLALDNALDEVCMNRLSMVKLLIELAESPTNNFSVHLEECSEECEEDIDWVKYLQEGIERWSPPVDDGSDYESDSYIENSECIETTDFIIKQPTDLPDKDNEDDVGQTMTYSEAKKELMANVQSTWFNRTKFCMKPLSDDPEANITFLWDDFIQDMSKGLVVRHCNIIAEYKVLREVIWQLYEPHSSTCFQFIGDTLQPVSNVTIGSVRLETFRSFLHEFLPYIQLLQQLREFSVSLAAKDDYTIPDTYRSYDYAVQTITKPIFVILNEVEIKIKSQETIFTLLSLANELRSLHQTMKVLRSIHNSVILDHKTNSATLCSTTLLARLYKGLFHASSKLEQDLYLTLYLHSLYKYFAILNSWLGRDVLEDFTNEFVIAEKAQQGEQDWHMEFFLKDLDEDVREDKIINLICTHVLQVGKNIHLLRLLGKMQLFFEYSGDRKENFYDVFINKVLEKISLYFGVQLDGSKESEEVAESLSPVFVFPAVCSDECKYHTEMDKLENLVDISDGFLVKAFESYFTKQPEPKQVIKETLYERIRKLTKSLFPVQNIIMNVFIDILEERYSILGFIVKNVLVHDYELERHFTFLQHIFLFKDDLIFPLYRHLFNALDSNGFLGNHTWLTSQLHDVIVDVHPHFYDKASVELNDNWRLVDTLKGCEMINIQCRIDWPVNIIIRSEHIIMYKELFQFILKIKWALYTLNHLYFTDLQPKGKLPMHRSRRKMIAQLKILRFGLLNIFSNIQHYILGHVFSEFSMKFMKAFDNSYDLATVIKAHSNFVFAFYKVCKDFQEYECKSYGFCMLLYLVQRLRLMWKGLNNFNFEDLDRFEKTYWICHEKLDSIINPAILVFNL
ncbi:hypothetical protein FQA39_LY12250 [Lamprigera yunnana]|nr:hypothetical protein FQA39_LY12250 [Lamprigera yunnana]